MVFVNNKGLCKHVKNIHGECHLEWSVRKCALLALLFSCNVHSLTFAKQKSVNRHMQEKHIASNSTDNPSTADRLLPTNTKSANPSVHVPAQQGGYYIAGWYLSWIHNYLIVYTTSFRLVRLEPSQSKVVANNKSNVCILQVYLSVSNS